MANVFGNPITDSTLQAMTEYANKEITAVDRARVAINMKNANMKAMNARNHVENLKKLWGTGTSTQCLVYNATGNPMKHLNSKDWYGHIGPGPHPTEILNGQWGAFLHVRGSVLAGSKAAVVYRGKNGKKGEKCHYMMAWSNPLIGLSNSVWAEAREVDHFDDEKIWDFISYKLETGRDKYEDSWEGCCSDISIGGGTSPTMEATFTLEDFP